jgi:hypothetical protein
MFSTYGKRQESVRKSASDAEKWREIKRPATSSLSLSQGEAGMPLSDRRDHRREYVCPLISETENGVSVLFLLQFLAG